jgi:hypothetical protein
MLDSRSERILENLNENIFKVHGNVAVCQSDHDMEIKEDARECSIQMPIYNYGRTHAQCYLT